MCYPPICNKLIRFLVWYLCDGGIGNNQWSTSFKSWYYSAIISWYHGWSGVLVFKISRQNAFVHHQALTGCVVDVPTLDGRLISIPINDIVKWVFYLHFFPIWYIIMLTWISKNNTLIKLPTSYEIEKHFLMCIRLIFKEIFIDWIEILFIHMSTRSR